MDAVDLSNNTTHFTVDHVRLWKSDGVELAIVQLITGVHLAGDDCATQIRTCLDGGLAVDVYVFPPNDGLALSPKQRFALIPADLKPKIRQAWIDVEKAYLGFASKVQVEEAHAAGDAALPWQQTGDYTALWVGQGTGWIPWPWPQRKQWLVYVRNDGAPNLGGAFAGTDNHVMTQYRMDVTMAGVAGMDRSLLSDAEAQSVTDWLNGGGSADMGAAEPTAADFRQALSYLRHDVMQPLRSYKYARVRAAVAEVERVAEQYGADV